MAEENIMYYNMDKWGENKGSLRSVYRLGGV